MRYDGDPCCAFIVLVTSLSSVVQVHLWSGTQPPVDAQHVPLDQGVLQQQQHLSCLHSRSGNMTISSAQSDLDCTCSMCR